MPSTTVEKQPAKGSHSAPASVASFEFTKRKRWAELLVSELSDCITLILSPSASPTLTPPGFVPVPGHSQGPAIWFCAPAVIELLGWSDVELVGTDLTALLNAEDRQAFLAAFSHSVHTREEMLVYARLRCKPRDLPVPPMPMPAQSSYATGGAYAGYAPAPVPPPPPPVPSNEILFEIKGYPHYMSEEMEGEPVGASSSRQQQECKCFLVMAKPYPSRNAAMLNSFLELKIENERLQQRLFNLRARHKTLQSGAPATSTPAVTAPSQPSISRYSTSSTYPPASTSSYSSYTPTSTSFSGMPYSAANTGNYSPTSPTAGPSSYLGYGEYTSPVSATSMGFGNDLFGKSAQGYGAASSSRYDTDNFASYGRVPGRESYDSGYAVPVDDEKNSVDEQGNKKKLKKVHGAEQYVCVTCGRTDSPEWRKGPHGPKTLCNACGLRYAKQLRKGPEGKEKGEGEKEEE